MIGLLELERPWRYATVCGLNLLSSLGCMAGCKWSSVWIDWPLSGVVALMALSRYLVVAWCMKSNIWTLVLLSVAVLLVLRLRCLFK